MFSQSWHGFAKYPPPGGVDDLGVRNITNEADLAAFCAKGGGRAYLNLSVDPRSSIFPLYISGGTEISGKMSVSDSAAASRSADPMTFFIIEDGAEVTINDFIVEVPAEVASSMDITVVSMDNAAVSAENYVVNVIGSSEHAKVTGIAIGPQTASGNINIVNSNPGTVTIDPANGSDKEIQDSIVDNNPAIPSEDVSAKYDAATAEDFIKNLAEYGEVRLTADIKAESIVVEGEEDPDLIGFFTSLPDSRTYDINLNGHVLDITTNYSIELPLDSVMTFREGNVDLNLNTSSPAATNIFVSDGATLNINQASVVFDHGGITPQKDSKVYISNSQLESYAYVIMTNASKDENDKPLDDNVLISITDKSTITSTMGLAVGLNVPGQLTIEDSNVYGDWNSVMVRGGNATIKNSLISANCNATGENKNELEGWGDGNFVPYASLVIGNFSSSYKYPTECSIENTEIVMKGTQDNHYKVYVASSNGEECRVDVTKIPEEYENEILEKGSYHLKDEATDILFINGKQITVNP